MMSGVDTRKGTNDRGRKRKTRRENIDIDQGNSFFDMGSLFIIVIGQTHLRSFDDS